MALSYSEKKTLLDEATQDVLVNRQRINQAISNVDTAVTSLNGMLTKYATLATDINAEITANPSSVTAINQKAALDALAAEFTALATYATGLQTAIAGVEE